MSDSFLAYGRYGCCATSRWQFQYLCADSTACCGKILNFTLGRDFMSSNHFVQVLATLFNLYSRIASILRIKRFQFSDKSIKDEQVEEGAEILRRGTSASLIVSTFSRSLPFRTPKTRTSCQAGGHRTKLYAHSNANS